MRATIALLLVLLALATFAACSDMSIRRPRCVCIRAPCNCDNEFASDKKIKVDDVLGWVGKGKQVYDIIKGLEDSEADEVEADLKLGKALKSIGKGALKVGKAYVGQKYGIQLSDDVIESDLKLGKALKSIGKGALKVGKAYVNQKYGIPLAESEFKIGKALKSIGKGALKVGKIYANAHGIPLADSEKINFEKVAEIIKKAKSIRDALRKKKTQQVEEESDKKINLDEIFEYVAKGKQIYDIVKSFKKSKNVETESDLKLGKALKSIGKGALKVGKAYVGQKYGIQLSDSGSKLSNSDALNRIRSAGIGISSSGGCHDRNNGRCTSLDQVNSGTIDGITTLKRASGCPITITGGTEVGHAGGAMSHYNGYKVDISLNSCIDGYITRSFANAGRRGDGAQMYRSSAGNVYAKEGNHWDITYL